MNKSNNISYRDEVLLEARAFKRDLKDRNNPLLRELVASLFILIVSIAFFCISSPAISPNTSNLFNV